MPKSMAGLSFRCAKYGFTPSGHNDQRGFDKLSPNGYLIFDATLKQPFGLSLSKPPKPTAYG